MLSGWVSGGNGLHPGYYHIIILRLPAVSRRSIGIGFLKWVSAAAQCTSHLLQRHTLLPPLPVRAPLQLCPAPIWLCSPPRDGATYSHFLDAYGLSSSLQRPQPRHPTSSLHATASTSVRTTVPQLHYPLHYTSSAIADFFPSYYRAHPPAPQVCPPRNRHALSNGSPVRHPVHYTYAVVGGLLPVPTSPPTLPPQGCAPSHQQKG